MCFFLITQSASSRLVLGPKPIHRAWGLAYYLSTVSLCSSWNSSCRLHSCPTCVNNSPIFPDLSSMVEKKQISTCCQTWFRMVHDSVKSCLTHVLSRWVDCSDMSTACHSGYDWGLTMTVNLSMMTQSKHHHVWRHDTQPWNPILHHEVGYSDGQWRGSRRTVPNICMLWNFLKNICQGLRITYICCGKMV